MWEGEGFDGTNQCENEDSDSDWEECESTCFEYWMIPADSRIECKEDLNEEDGLCHDWGDEGTHYEDGVLIEGGKQCATREEISCDNYVEGCDEDEGDECWGHYMYREIDGVLYEVAIDC